MTARTNYLLLVILLIGLAVMVSIFTSPIAILTAATCVAIAAVALLRIEWLRNLAMVAVSVIGALLAAETYVTLDQPSATQVRGSTVYAPQPPFAGDSQLGYRYRANQTIQATRTTNDGRPIYSVGYTFDQAGRRATPGSGEGDWVLFAGCSFTMGEGLNDDETLPAAFARDNGGRYHVVNLGVSGYGAHQFVRMLELDTVQIPSDRKVHAVVFSLLGTHAHRAAGLPPYARSAPKYVLDDAGVPRFVGSFQNAEWWKSPVVWLRDGFRSLRIGTLLLDWINGGDYVDLNIALVKRAADLVRQRYGVELIVVAWSSATDIEAMTMARLRTSGLHVIEVGDLLPANPGEFLIALDGHPNKLANQLIAKSLFLQLQAHGP